MREKSNVAKLLAKAKKPSEDALRSHPLHRGKIEVTPTCPVKDCNCALGRRIPRAPLWRDTV